MVPLRPPRPGGQECEVGGRGPHPALCPEWCEPHGLTSWTGSRSAGAETPLNRTGLLPPGHPSRGASPVTRGLCSGGAGPAGAAREVNQESVWMLKWKRGGAPVCRVQSRPRGAGQRPRQGSGGRGGAAGCPPAPAPAPQAPAQGADQNERRGPGGRFDAWLQPFAQRRPLGPAPRRPDLVAMGASGLLRQLQPGQAVEKTQTDIFPERTEAQMESVS